MKVVVHLSTFFQRWQNNVKKRSIELRLFNVDELTLFQHLFIDVASTLTNNVETTLKEYRRFNVGNPVLFQR